MTSRRVPRRLGDALAETMKGAAPATPLAAAQSAWADAVGERIAAEARPVAESDGVLTVSCSSSTWAQELDLLAPELLERLSEALSGADRPRTLRFRVGDH